MSDNQGEEAPLPQGYHERICGATNRIISEAVRIMHIMDEFNCNNVVLTGEGCRVTVERDGEDWQDG